MECPNRNCLICELKRYPNNQKTKYLKQFLSNLNVTLMEYSIDDYSEKAYNFYINNIFSTNPIRINKRLIPFKKISKQYIKDHLCRIKSNQPGESSKSEKSEKTNGNNPEDLICNICQENRINVIILDCGHALCKDCSIRIMTKGNKNCPYCRKDIIKGILNIYL